MTLRNILSLFVLPILVAHGLSAQTRSFARAAGNSTVSVVPDQFKLTLRLGYSGSAEPAPPVNYAERAADVIGAITAVLGKSGSIRTTSADSGAGTATSSSTSTMVYYAAGASFEVTGDDPLLAGPVIDVAVARGVMVSDLRFILRDSEAAMLTAFKIALRQARTHADAIASALGMRVGAVRMVREGFTGPTSVFIGYFLGPADIMASPERNTFAVTQSVTLEVELVN